jgi:hypothetical protein
MHDRYGLIVGAVNQPRDWCFWWMCAGARYLHPCATFFIAQARAKKVAIQLRKLAKITCLFVFSKLP